MASRKKRITVTDLKVPSDYSVESTGITQSLLGKYCKCPRSFVLAVNRYGHPNKKNFYFGDVTHATIDYVYNTYCTQNRKPDDVTTRTFLNKYCNSVAKKYGTLPPADREREKVLSWVMVTEYIKYYGTDFTEKKFEFTEKVFDTKYGSSDVLLRGKIDGGFYLDKDLWLMEHKTMSQINEETILNELNMNFQNLFYITAYENETKQSVKGVLYNVIRKPSLRKTESLLEMEKRLRSEVQKNSEHYFKRWEVVYTAQQKKQFRIDLWYILQDLRFHIEDNNFYQNRFSCKSGVLTCSYLQACAANDVCNLVQSDHLFEELDD